MLDWFLGDFYVLGLHVQHWIAAFAIVLAIWIVMALLDRHNGRTGY
jgi:hypothetical protein